MQCFYTKIVKNILINFIEDEIEEMLYPNLVHST